MSNEVNLSTNPVVGGLQMLGWLFLRPSAWRQTINQIAPNLPPDFSLAELAWADWHNPALGRFLLGGYAFVALVEVLLCLLFWGGGLAGEGIFFGAVMGPAAGLMVGLTVSAGAGLAMSLAMGLATLAYFGQSDLLTIHLFAGSVFGVIFGISSGVTGYVAANIHPSPPAHSVSRQMGGVFLGLLLSITFITLTVGTVLTVLNAFSLPDIVSGAMAVAVGSGSGIGIVFAAAIWRRTRRWQTGLRFGVIVGLFSGALFFFLFNRLFNQQIGGLHLLLATSGQTIILFCAIFILSYTLTEPVAGAPAAAVTGALAGSSVHLAAWVVTPLYNPLWNIAVTLLLLAVGLSMGRWRPWLFFPVQVAWNAVLFYLDRRQVARPSLLRYHTAFWDEVQGLPLPDLDRYLIWTAERNPTEGQAAISTLTPGRQRWAAQVAQTELEIRKLENQADIETLGQIHRELVAGELIGPATAFLNSFNRISRDIHLALQQVTPVRRQYSLRIIEQQLNQFQQQLRASENEYRDRFIDISRQWLQIIDAHQQHLARQRVIQRDIDNVYTFGVPLTQKHLTFVGRTGLAARLSQHLGHDGSGPVLLYGQRRMGKTSFLQHLAQLLPPHTLSLFIDGERLSGAGSFADLLAGLARAITESARRSRVTLPEFQPQTIEPDAQFSHWLSQVEAAVQAAGHRTVLFAFDEFETMEATVRRRRLREAELLATFKQLSRAPSTFRLLLAGSHAPDELLYCRSYLAQAKVLKIGYLKKTTAMKLIEQPVGDFGLQYQPEASHLVYRLTRGHPHLIQLLCYEIVRHKNELGQTARNLIEPADVDAGAMHALRHGRKFFTDIEYNLIDAAGRILLYWLAAQGPDNVTSKAELAQVLDKTGDPDQVLHVLLQRDLIEYLNSGYRFQVELIRRWFAAGPRRM